jgi:hypothetical protein
MNFTQSTIFKKGLALIILSFFALSDLSFALSPNTNLDNTKFQKLFKSKTEKEKPITNVSLRDFQKDTDSLYVAASRMPSKFTKKKLKSTQDTNTDTNLSGSKESLEQPPLLYYSPAPKQLETNQKYFNKITKKQKKAKGKARPDISAPIGLTQPNSNTEQLDISQEDYETVSRNSFMNTTLPSKKIAVEENPKTPPIQAVPPTQEVTPIQEESETNDTTLTNNQSPSSNNLLGNKSPTVYNLRRDSLETTWGFKLHWTPRDPK